MSRRLKGLTLALLWPQERDEHSCAFIKELAVELTERGAQVFNISRHGLSGKFLKVMDVQAVLGFTVGKSQVVRFVYSRRRKEENLRLLSLIARELFKGEKPAKAGIAGLPSILGNCGYLKLSLLPLPALFIEIDGATGEADCRSAVMGALLSLYGQETLEETALPTAQGEEQPIPEPESEEEIPLPVSDEDMETLPPGWEIMLQEIVPEEAEEMEVPPIQEEPIEIRAAAPAEEPDITKPAKRSDDRKPAGSEGKEKKKAHKRTNTFNPGGGPVFRFVPEE